MEPVALGEVPPNTPVVTSTFVTADSLPILEAHRDYDEEEGDIWQFHAGNGDYSRSKLQLVSAAQILKRDPGLATKPRLLRGWSATRKSTSDPWILKEGA
jgi:hypothetical protein